MAVSKRRLKMAYDEVFSVGHTSKVNIDLVINDIQNKTFINKIIKGTNIERNEKEGKRQIGIHLNNMLAMDISDITKLEAKIKKEDFTI